MSECGPSELQEDGQLVASPENAARLLRQMLSGANACPVASDSDVGRCAALTVEGAQTETQMEAATNATPPVQPIDSDTLRIALFYDPLMTVHRNLDDDEHPEQPLRVVSIFAHLELQGLASRCLRIPCRLAERRELELKHTTEHVDAMFRVADLDDEDAAKEGRQYNSVYLCSKSTMAARLSAGSVIEAVARVCTGEVRRAVCVVRPPGHHAECNRPMGFCMFGNVALAAAEARRQDWSDRVLIIDWDVHHGNGTQQMFEEDPTVLYFSIHRHDNGKFYPHGRLGHYESHGLGVGAGFSVNVPWDVKGAWRKGVLAPGDAEYISAFERVLLPIAADFAPDLILISAGFDSAHGDPIGDCRVSPAGFHKLTEMAMTLADGRTVLALEGGYNLESISASMAACVSALLGDELPPPPPSPDREGECILPKSQPMYEETIDHVIRHFSRFWPSMQVAAENIASQQSEVELPAAALNGSLKEMRRALRHHARDTGRTLEELTRQHDQIVFKLKEVPTLDSELNCQRRHRALLQSFHDAGSTSLPFMLPIVHIQSCEQAVKNVSIAVDAGAHGVWLINSGDAGVDNLSREPPERKVHRTTLQAGASAEHASGQAQLIALAECFQAVREAFPDFWIGLCVPQLNAAQVFLWLEQQCVTADALWLDDLACQPAAIVWETMGEGIYALHFAIRLKKWLDLKGQLHLQAVKNARRRCSWMGLVFGTVASRFQERFHHDQDSESMGEACRAILRHWALLVGSACDVIVTTGPGDGGPCASAKLRALSAAKPVACLGPVANGRAGQCDSGNNANGADLLFLDVAELGAGLDAKEFQRNRLRVDPERLKDWVVTGSLSSGDTSLQYEPGDIRRMATAALEETRKRSERRKDVMEEASGDESLTA